MYSFFSPALKRVPFSQISKNRANCPQKKSRGPFPKNSVLALPYIACLHE